ncbi:hypothetical protein HDU81_001867 [Chytriomyces hyalinus]|nr:hypothetical protein HDU81_001867 [Chytriomyces hyalinus]
MPLTFQRIARRLPVPAAFCVVAVFLSWILAQSFGDNCLPYEDNRSLLSCQDAVAYYIRLPLGVGTLSTLFSVLEKASTLLMETLVLVAIATWISNGSPFNVGLMLSMSLRSPGSLEGLMHSMTVAATTRIRSIYGLLAFSIPGPIVLVLLLYWQSLLTTYSQLIVTAPTAIQANYQVKTACLNNPQFIQEVCNINAAATNQWFRNESAGLKIHFNSSSTSRVLWDQDAVPVLVPAINDTTQSVTGKSFRLASSCRSVSQECKHGVGKLGSTTPYACSFPNANVTSANSLYGENPAARVIQYNVVSNLAQDKAPQGPIMTSRGVQLFSNFFYNSQGSLPDRVPEWVIPVHGGISALVLCEMWMESVDYVATQKSVLTSNTTILPLDTSRSLLFGIDVNSFPHEYAVLMTEEHALQGDKTTYFNMTGRFYSSRILANIAAPSFDVVSGSSVLTQRFERVSVLPRKESLGIAFAVFGLCAVTVAAYLVLLITGETVYPTSQSKTNPGESASTSNAARGKISQSCHAFVLDWLTQPVHVAYDLVMGPNQRHEENSLVSEVTKIGLLETQKRSLVIGHGVMGLHRNSPNPEVPWGPSVQQQQEGQEQPPRSVMFLLSSEGKKTPPVVLG